MNKAELRKQSHRLGNATNGVVEVRGGFYEAHREEILHLLERTVEIIQASHPFEKIISRSENGERLILEVTSAKLAERLGHTLDRAFGGKTIYEMLGDTGQARIYWEREAALLPKKVSAQKIPMKNKGKLVKR